MEATPVTSIDSVNGALASADNIDHRTKALKTTQNESNENSIRVVVFSLAGQEHAVDVHQVKEIIMAPHVSPLVEAHFFIEGVIKLRGKIVPVVHLRKALKLEAPDQYDKGSVVIIVKLSNKTTGFRVDSVSELLSIPIKSIEPPKGIVGGVDAHFIKGLAYIGERFLVILNLNAIMSENQEQILMDTCEGPALVDSDEYAEQERLTFRRIISFNLDDELYGAEIGEVAEIMEMTPIMPIPNVPDFILGLINLRGTIVPVVDLRARFGLDIRAWTPESRIVIMKEKNLLVGVVVDSMWESLKLQEDAFQPTPQGVAKVDAEYFREICSVKGRMVSILDIGKILTDTAARNVLANGAEALLKYPALRLESHH